MLYRPSSLRKKATAFAAATAMMGAASFATDAQAGDFTTDQCRLISTVSTDVMKTVGVSKLSEQFRISLVNFIMPEVNGKRAMTCDGSKDILTPTGPDSDAYNVIRKILLAPPAKISLQQAGLRSIDPAAQAARRPAVDKRTELITATPAPKAD